MQFCYRRACIKSLTISSYIYSDRTAHHIPKHDQSSLIHSCYVSSLCMTPQAFSILQVVKDELREAGNELLARFTDIYIVACNS